MMQGADLAISWRCSLNLSLVSDAILKLGVLIVSGDKKGCMGFVVQVCKTADGSITALRSGERGAAEAKLALLKRRSSCKVCEGDEDG